MWVSSPNIDTKVSVSTWLFYGIWILSCFWMYLLAMGYILPVLRPDRDMNIESTIKMILSSTFLAAPATAFVFSVGQVSPRFRASTKRFTVILWIYAAALLVLPLGLLVGFIPSPFKFLFYAMVMSYAFLPLICRRKTWTKLHSVLSVMVAAGTAKPGDR